MLLWYMAAGGALAGGIALVILVLWARSLRRRIEHLNQAYWELRYQYTQLRADVARLDPETSKPASQPEGRPDVSFVPLSSLKK
jgi:hypothetical protein